MKLLTNENGEETKVYEAPTPTIPSQNTHTSSRKCHILKHKILAQNQGSTTHSSSGDKWLAGKADMLTLPLFWEKWRHMTQEFIINKNQ